ncbi:hypothetical protein HDU81_011405, partial [Chytriomyces hyalinus]
VHATFKTTINKNSCCIHTELHKVLNQCSTVSDHHVKALKKQWDNLTQEAHEDIPALLHKFHTILENIIANPTVPAFAECITFANHKEKLINSLHMDFANQKGCIKADEEHDTLDKLQMLLETIAYEINFDPRFAAFKHAHNLENQKGTQQPQRKPNTTSGTPSSEDIAHLTEHLHSDPGKTSTFFSMLTQLITPTPAGAPGPSNSSLVMFLGFKYAQE